MGILIFVCLSVGIRRSNGNPNPCMDLHLSKGGIWCKFDPFPWAWGPKTLKAEGNIFTKQKMFSRLPRKLMLGNNPVWCTFDHHPIPLGPVWTLICLDMWFRCS